ncbi:sodium- and chloride-dependent neutral and basic amino acid transporter B(0+)-like isoform X2 [Physella acuta]|uniref:sodium- and chloride-dependent neutral and basic amino acid transporter B(0+)-like isoform X2 n=1 Tax=Physella acuta TaxID=109671 RepID=UPI0027DCB083|nr:sodium- and chloride-dependent neutral and basic amino acid transporter B(0+)-like isoform X2 [Physella acuta]
MAKEKKEKPESDERPSWGRHLDFIVTCIGNAVGLGNIWRFPHLAYVNGGGAFLIPYTISLFFMGIPLFCLELLIGQFTNVGPITIWEINILFKGLGYTTVTLAAIICIYYNLVVATSFYYLFASMQATLPWSTCGNDWNTCYCRTPEMNTTLGDPMMWYNATKLNCSGIEFNKTDIKLSSEEYYYRYVLEATDGIFDLGRVKWDLTLCNLLAWVIICACLIKGVKTMGKAVYFFALFPYVLMTVLLVRGVTLDGAKKGIDYYLTPDTSKLKEAKVWKAAAAQIFFSLSCCTGSLAAMSSYNKFNNNVLRDSIMVPIINCLTSFYAGFAIFSILGYMAETTGVAVENVTTDGQGLIFVAYPEALSQLPVPQLWSVFFFLMLICLGLGTQFPSVETVLTALQDEFAYFRRKNVAMLFRISVCIIGFLLGLPMTTQGGTYLQDLCDIFVGLPLLLVGFLEILVIVWIYGVKNFAEDVLLMVGGIKSSKYLFYGYFIWNWVFFAPVLILAIIVFECVQYEPITDEHYPDWAEALGWSIVAAVMVWTPLCSLKD